MWSNVAVDDAGPDDVSPWTRDDWDADRSTTDDAVFDRPPRVSAQAGRPTATGSDEPPPTDFERDADASTSRSSFGRTMVAGAVVAALVIGSAGALLRNDAEPDATPTATRPDDRSPTTSDAPLDMITPTTERSITVPSTVSAGEVVETPDEIPVIVVGEPPAWAERTIAVPENLATMEPTEVITLDESGIVNVTEFPSGRTRSLDVSELGAQARLAVGERTLVAFNSTTMRIIRDGEPVVESRLADGVIFVQPWTGTGNFVVITPSTGPNAPEQNWLLRPDGSLAPLDNVVVSEEPFFSRVFSPDGDALVTAPGGVYAISPDGSSRRISTGALIAIGKRHWAIEECDERLRCAYSIIEWDTGTVTSGVLDRVDQFGVIDPATHISPDGRSIVFRAGTDGAGRREILDVASGITVEAGSISQFFYPDAWATDSSGVFITERFLQFADHQTGAITEIDGLGAIRTVATGSFGIAE